MDIKFINTITMDTMDIKYNKYNKLHKDKGNIKYVFLKF